MGVKCLINLKNNSIYEIIDKLQKRIEMMFGVKKEEFQISCDIFEKKSNSSSNLIFFIPKLIFNDTSFLLFFQKNFFFNNQILKKIKN